MGGLDIVFEFFSDAFGLGLPHILVVFLQFILGTELALAPLGLRTRRYEIVLNQRRLSRQAPSLGRAFYIQPSCHRFLEVLHKTASPARVGFFPLNRSIRERSGLPELRSLEISGTPLLYFAIMGVGLHRPHLNRLSIRKPLKHRWIDLNQLITRRLRHCSHRDSSSSFNKCLLLPSVYFIESGPYQMEQLFKHLLIHEILIPPIQASVLPQLYHHSSILT